MLKLPATCGRVDRDRGSECGLAARPAHRSGGCPAGAAVRRGGDHDLVDGAAGKAASSQTTYSSPVVGSTATEGSVSCVRSAAPVLGSISNTVCSLETTDAFDQVAPPSVEVTNETLSRRGVN